MSALPSFSSLHQRADARIKPVGVAVAGGADETVLKALSDAQTRGWVHPVLCGKAAEITALSEQLQISLSCFELIDSDTPAVAAVEQIHQGRAALLMKGQIATPDLMRAVLNKENGLRTGKTIAQMVLMEISRDSRTFLMTDTGITIEPTLDQKQELLDHICETAAALGQMFPRIAIMSATEKVNKALPDTNEAAQLAAEYKRHPCEVAGPLSFDLAYAAEAGQRKKLNNDVIGQADAMLFPNLLTANLTVKSIMYTADCQFGGVLCGTTAPVVFMSRADDVKTRLNSLAYALVVSDHRST